MDRTKQKKTIKIASFALALVLVLSAVVYFTVAGGNENGNNVHASEGTYAHHVHCCGYNHTDNVGQRVWYTFCERGIDRPGFPGATCNQRLMICHAGCNPGWGTVCPTHGCTSCGVWVRDYNYEQE
ncbi:MAG: hypothetical protein FWC95_04010 [Defluviitaleaceae bacterium]|nr:hypothetical protein [Defluviitaleaceae bacterium]